MSIFSERLKLLRAERAVLQADISSELGIKPQSYSAYENGREPNYEILCRMADYFDVTLDYMLGRSDIRQAEQVDVAAKTNLSPKAVQSLTNMVDGGEMYRYHHSVVNFLLENAWSTRFLEYLYKYLFSTLYFSDPKKAASLNQSEDIELYDQVFMVVRSEDARGRGTIEGRSLIKNTDLNDMYFVKVQSELMRLRESAIKRRMEESTDAQKT